MPPFNVISGWSTPEIVLSRKSLFFLKSVSKVANWIIVDILKYLLLTLCYHWEILSNSFILEMAIAKVTISLCNTLHTSFLLDSSLLFKLMF